MTWGASASGVDNSLLGQLNVEQVRTSTTLGTDVVKFVCSLQGWLETSENRQATL